MIDLVIASLGAAAGLFVARLHVRYMLPRVLEMIEVQRTNELGLPLFPWDKLDRQRMIRLIYGIAVPIGLGIMGALFALQLFGGGE